MHLAERSFEPSSLRTVRKSPSQRRFWKIISGSPDASAGGAMSCSASATDAAKGLSMTRAAPAASADEALLEVDVGRRAEHDEVDAPHQQFLGRSRRSRRPG